MKEQLLYCPEYDFLATLRLDRNDRLLMDMSTDDMGKMARLQDDARDAGLPVVDYTDFIYLGSIEKDGPND